MSLVDRFRTISADRFATTIALLYVLTFLLGGYIYPTFVLDGKAASAVQQISELRMSGLNNVVPLPQEIQFAHVRHGSSTEAK